ncbi:MAG: hypothetical protein ABJO36_14785 [Litorimonas sp.]
MFKKILLAGACCIVLTGCEKTDNSTPKDAVETAETPVVEVVQKPRIPPLEACKYAAEIKARNMAASTNAVVTSETDNEYNFDFTTENGVASATCVYNEEGVTKVTVGGSVANAGITRSVQVDNGVFLPISELPHIAGSTLTEEGSLVSFYTIFQTQTPTAPACLFVTYKADASNKDSIFLSFNGAAFVNSFMPVTGEDKGVASFELPSEPESVTVRATNRELPNVYGFEVKTCS